MTTISMFSTCLCTEITLSFSRSLPQTHTQYRHALADRNLSALPSEFINEIVLQLKRYMTFFSSKVLEAVQLKDSLDSAAEHR